MNNVLRYIHYLHWGLKVTLKFLCSILHSLHLYFIIIVELKKSLLIVYIYSFYFKNLINNKTKSSAGISEIPRAIKWKFVVIRVKPCDKIKNSIVSWSFIKNQTRNSLTIPVKVIICWCNSI